MSARPTTLRLFVDRCPAAVDLYEANAPADRSVYATGTAAHDVLDTIARFGLGSAAIEDTVQKLITSGRGGVDAEPPLPPDRVFAGRNIALAYAEAKGVPEGWPELGLAFDEAWNPVEYTSDAAWFRVRLDLAFVASVDDEESVGIGIVVRDYKTAWTAGEDLLDSIQMRAQAVAAVSQWQVFELTERPDFVRREIVNLRTMRTFSVDLWLDEDGNAQIEQWRQDIATMSAAVNAKPRRARPGIHCLGCEYVAVCPAARALAEGMPVDPVDIAEAYAAAQGVADELRELAKAAADGGAIETPDGVVGYIAKDKRQAKPDAYRSLWDAWTKGREIDSATDGLARGFLASLNWGSGMVEAAAKGLFPGRKQAQARREFVAGLVETVTHKEFGVQRRAPATTTDSDRSHAIEETP